MLRFCRVTKPAAPNRKTSVTIKKELAKLTLCGLFNGLPQTTSTEVIHVPTGVCYINIAPDWKYTKMEDRDVAKFEMEGRCKWVAVNSGKV